MTQQLLPQKTQQHVSRRAPRSDFASSFQGGLHPIAQLQRTLGNRHVAQLIQAKQLTPEGKIIGLRRKLTVGAADDQYEQEANRVARQVMSMPNAIASNSVQRAISSEEGKDERLQPKSLAASITPFVQRQIVNNEESDDKKKPVQTKFLTETSNEPMQRQPETEEEDAEPIQTKSAGSLADSFEAGADVETQVSLSKGRGSSLPEPVRAYMEPRFGMDFSHVHVHTGSDALQMNQAVGAQAFTHGSDIYFGVGHSPTNLELTAHELTHVLQQTGRVAPGPEPPIRRICAARDERAVMQRVALQRDSKKEEKLVPQDFAVLLSPDKDFVTLATAIAPDAKVLRATSVDDLAKQLKAIKVPVRTLYFVAHMNEDGDLLFTSPGKLTFVPAEAIASKIKDSAQVESIDFRGCQIAQAPAEMDKIRVALKASKVTGSTCTFVKQTADPITIGGKAITRPEDLSDKKVKTAFDAGFKKLHELFVDARKKCIINDSTDGYFQTGGRLMAVWVNPGSMADDAGWDDKKSICYKDLKVEKVDPTKKLPVIGPDDCKLVEVG